MQPQQKIDAPTPALTPMMAQYQALKAQHPDCLLLFRLGDFYEMFFEDAVAASAALDITLTRRGKSGEDEIPMCGVPWHQADTYLPRLVAKGFRVAIAEQAEAPEAAKKRGGAKAIVERRVTRILTPGTLTEDSMLAPKAHNFLAALANTRDQYGLAWVDISTGEFFVEPLNAGELAPALARLNAREVLLPQKLLEAPTLYEVWADWRDALNPQPDSRFSSEGGSARLQQAFGLAALDSLGDLSRAELAAAGSLLDYINLTQQGKLPGLMRPRRLAASGALQIDAASRRNLELTQRLDGARRGSLLDVMDETVTAAGGRMLAAWLSAPLVEVAAIQRRLDAVARLVANSPLRGALRQTLATSADLGRALSRLNLDRGGPRDLAAIASGLEAACQLQDILLQSGEAPEGLAQLAGAIGRHGDLIHELRRALGDDLPFLARDGGFIAAGYDPRLDELKELRDEGGRHIRALQEKYSGETRIPSLKIKHNNILGHFIEVTTTHVDKVPDSFIHRQTMSGVVRYSTPELNELQGKILRASEQALALELEIFARLTALVVQQGEAIRRSAEAVAALDVLAGLAHLATVRRYIRPQVVAGDDFHITAGRHPVVEAHLAENRNGGTQTDFAANDACLEGTQKICLLTGPNMAGKSTWLRQNALITLMAQMGSFVPAAAARIGVVDKLFCRVGAADDLARGRSTFMVEMVETATILNLATEKSLVILDEIGRGTATFDGLSIAWACLEYLHNVNRCRTLFATHYHELTSLAARLKNLACYTMQIKEWQDEIIFLHQVARGQADRSYGVHVAKLAGLPEAVTRRASEILALLEQDQKAAALKTLADDLPLFAATKPVAVEVKKDSLRERLATIDPDALTPREALEALYELKREA
jgi:DNA mismatch repair protein MutS